MADGSYQLIEVKRDNMIDDEVVKAKKTAAQEMAVASGIDYIMYPGSLITSTHILEDKPKVVQYTVPQKSEIGVVSENHVPYGEKK